MGTVRAYVPKGALCALRHSEDVLIFLSGELSAKFLNNNGEQERGVGGEMEKMGELSYQPRLGYA